LRGEHDAAAQIVIGLVDFVDAVVGIGGVRISRSTSMSAPSWSRSVPWA
jgi:hypothetical protein